MSFLNAIIPDWWCPFEVIWRNHAQYGGRAQGEDIGLHHDEVAGKITWEYGTITRTDGNETVDCLFTESSPINDGGNAGAHLYGESHEPAISVSLTGMAAASDAPEVNVSGAYSGLTGAAELVATSNVQTFETADILQEATDMAVRQLEQG